MKIRLLITTIALIVNLPVLNAQTGFEKYQPEAVNVSMSKVNILGKDALMAIKDPKIKDFDEPTFIRLNGIDFKNGTIEVKVLSKLLRNAPDFARGFIGIAFHINNSNTGYESIYVRPLNARADDQVRRNHTIQYYSYPDYKFDRLRKESPGMYEAYADMEMNKWINLRIEVKDSSARLFIDNHTEPSLIVQNLKRSDDGSGAIGLWVDIGTEGYFADLKITNDFNRQPQPGPLRAFMQKTPAVADAIPYGANEKKGRYVKAGDANIYYEVYGEGKPVAILHGGVFGSTYEMREFIDSLRKNHQVIAISTRGHGKSELGIKPISFEQKANDVVAVLNQITTDSVTILGFSDGGFTAFKLASMYPSRVKKIIVIGASEFKSGDREFAFDVKQSIALDTAYWRQQFAMMPQPERLQEMFTMLGNMYSKLTLDKQFFETIKCPALIMAGDRDESNPVERVLNTARMIRHSQISIIPNSSHGVFLENFPAVWTSIVPFIEKN